MNETVIINLPAIDPERDIYPVLVVTPSYDGEPIAHLLVTGERVMRLTRDHTKYGEVVGWNYHLPLLTYTEERDAAINFMYLLGELHERHQQRAIEALGGPDEEDVFDQVMGMLAGDRLCDYVELLESKLEEVEW